MAAHPSSGHDAGILDSVLQDLRYGFRGLIQRPGFTAVVVVTLALGIGANAAIFAVFHAVILRPLPYEEPGRLYLVWESHLQKELPIMFAAPPNYADWREQNQVFEEMAVFDRGGAFLTHEGEPERLQAARVSASFFPLLGVDPHLGRGFTVDEDRPNGPRAAVLGHGLWQRRFAADPEVVGRTVEIDGASHTVVGVMPEGFHFPPSMTLEGTASSAKTELWLPLATDLAGGQRGAHYLTAMARLAPGVSRDRAQAEMAAIAERLERQYPPTNDGWSITLVPLREQLFGPSRPALLVLAGAVGFVLLIVCLNVANLLLARGAARRKELAVRAALGAGKLRLVRQMLTESVALAVCGGAAGLALSRATLSLLVDLAPRSVPRLDETGLDAAVVGFTFAVSLAVGVVFGLAPAWQGTSLDLASWLKEKGSGSALGGRRLELRHALVVAEVAISLVLLVGAGLLLESFVRLRGVDLGFARTQVLTMGVTLPQGSYPERRQWAPVFGEIERQVAAVDEVEAAGLILELPLVEDRQGTGFLFAHESDLPPGVERQVNFTFITPGYRSAMGVPLVDGRDFDSRDHADAPPVILVNQALVRRYFGGEKPLGQRLRVGFDVSTPREIVGVVGDVRHDKLARGGFPGIYVPYGQVPWRNRMALVARTSGTPAAVLPAVRERIRSVDPRIPVHDVRSVDEIVAEALAPQRFSTTLLSVFAALALVLAAVGIYGVISYSVHQRTREIGLRVALGARTGEVVRMVLGQGMALALAGVVLGCLGALALTRFVASQLYQVSARDPAVFAGVAAVLGAVALAACWVPARRAAGVDPTRALRDE